jgi:molybdenum cofactor cytidylyltransferase
MERIAGIILAAGESARMGRDKALLRWGGATFLEHLRAVLKNAGLGLVRVVLGANADGVLKQVRLAPVEVVLNRQWHQGMLTSVVAGLDSLPRGLVDAAVLCLVDHPCVSSALLRTLVERFRATGKLIVLPVCQGQRGHPALFSAKLFDELRAAPLAVGARHVVRQHPDDVLEVPTEEDGILLNTNDPAAYEKILQKTPPG